MKLSCFDVGAPLKSCFLDIVNITKIAILRLT